MQGLVPQETLHSARVGPSAFPDLALSSLLHGRLLRFGDNLPSHS